MRAARPRRETSGPEYLPVAGDKQSYLRYYARQTPRLVLDKLGTLESLALTGVWPFDGRLDALHSLAKLNFLHISHVYRFTLEQCAALRRALPNAVGHCLEPYFTLPQLDVRCKRCDAQVVFLTGARPRTPRQLCPNCQAPRLQEHIQRWNAFVQGAAGRDN